MANTTDQGPPQDYDTLAQLCASAASHAERAVEISERNSTDIADLKQDVQLAIVQNARLREDVTQRLDGLESGQKSLEAGQQRLEAMVGRILERLEGNTDG